jgi:uncharacterized protein
VRRYYAFITAHPVLVLVAAALVALGVGSGVLRLRRETSPDAFIPKSHPALSGKQRVDELFGLTEPIAVGVIRDGPGGIFTPRTLGLIHDLTAAIQRLPQVDSNQVLSLATESAVYFDKDGEPGFDLMMKQAPTDATGCEALKKDVMGYKLYRGTLVAADGSAACIVIRLRDEGPAEAIYLSLCELLARSPVTDERLVVAGEAAVRAHMGKAVSDDALRMNLIAPVLMVALIVLAFRTWRGTILPLCVIGGASAVALGAMGWCGVPVYIVTNGIFVVILALSVSDSLATLGQYYEEHLTARGRTRQQVVVETCTLLWFPVLVTSATDFTGFLANYVTGEMPPIMYFSLFTCAGVMGAWVYSITVVPAALALLPLRGSRAYARRNQPGVLDWLGMALGRLGEQMYERRQPVLWCGAALTVAAFVGALNLRVNDARLLAFKEHHPIVQASKVLNERFDGTSHLNIVLTASGQGGLLESAMLRRIEALEQFTETLPQVGSTHSLAGWVKRAHQKLHEEKPEYYAIPADPADTRFYLDALTAKTSPLSRLLLEVVDPTYTVANLIVRLRSSEYVHERAVVQAVERYLAGHFTDASLRAEVAGRVNLDYHWLRLIKTSHIEGVMMSAGCTLLLTAWMFRSWAAGGLCTLVVGLVVVINYALMGWSGIPLGVGTSMFASIAIGVGVNFPIHILDRLRHHLAVPGAEARQAFRQTLACTGRSMFFAAAVVAVGFLVLLISEFRTLNEFGLLIGMAMVMSFVLSVTLLPALVAACRPRFIWGQQQAVPERPREEARG